MTTLAFPRFSIKTILNGAAYGCLAGFLASEIFVVSIATLAFANELWQQKFASAVFTTALGFGLGQIYGVLPSVVIGLISGCVIGGVFALLPARTSISRKQGLIIGAASAVALIFVILLALYIRAGSPNIQFTTEALPTTAFCSIIVLF